MSEILTPDELEQTCNYNYEEMMRVRERDGEDNQLHALFEQRMNNALEALSPFYQVASAVVLELTDET